MATPTFPELLAQFHEAPGALVGRVPGFFVVHKPAGMTSHDVVDAVRRRLGLRKVGHGGTLDPMAEGVLLLLAGRATRLFDAVQTLPKMYRAWFRLGARTDTQDSTGEVIASAPSGALPVERERVENALELFRGEILQTPPMHSALKRNGRPLYALAREGKVVERKARRVRVSSLALQDFDGASGAIELTVSSGFYVRTLIDDLGEALGVGAHMTALVRTAIGPFALQDAVPPEGIAPPEERGGP